MDRGPQQRRRACLGGGLLEHDAHGLQHRGAGLGQNIHQMRNRRPRITAHIGNTGLKQRLGDGKDRLAMKGFTLAKAQLFHLGGKRAFHPAAAARGVAMVERKIHAALHQPGLMPRAALPPPRAGMRASA